MPFLLDLPGPIPEIKNGHVKLMSETPGFFFFGKIFETPYGHGLLIADHGMVRNWISSRFCVSCSCSKFYPFQDCDVFPSGNSLQQSEIDIIGNLWNIKGTSMRHLELRSIIFMITCGRRWNMLENYGEISCNLAISLFIFLFEIWSVVFKHMSS